MTAGARLVLASHLGRPKKGPAPEFSLKPVAARLSELLGVPVTMAPDCVGAEVAARWRRARPTAACCCSRTCASTRRRRRTTPPSPRGSIADSGATVFVNDAFGTAHRAHASTEGVSHHVATSRRRPPDGEGAALPRHGARGAGAAVRGRPRRRQGLGQDRGHREPAAARRRAARRRRHGVHVPPRPGARHGEEPGRGGQGRPRARRCSRRRGGKLRLPVDHVVASAFKATPSARRCPSTEMPDGLDGPRHRPADGARVRGRGGPREARALERADGRLRDGAVRAGHAGGGAALADCVRHHDRGRRRQRRRGHADGPRRQDRPRLDRRRRVARVPEPASRCPASPACEEA